MAVKRGLFKTKAKEAESEKEDSALDKQVRWTSNRIASEYEEKALEEPHHSENCDNVSSQTDDVMPDSPRGSLCTRSEAYHFESVESGKGNSSADVSCEQARNQLGHQGARRVFREEPRF